MKIGKYILVLILSVLLGCNNGNKNIDPMEMFRPEWSNIDTVNLELQFGDLIGFESDSQNIKALVLDFDKDEAGIWYGMCFLNKNQLFGRQIPSGIAKYKCLDLYDLTYLNEKGLKKYKKINHFDIDINKIGVGSVSPAININEIIRNFQHGIEQRKKQQTPCNEGLYDLNPVRECYFEFEGIRNITKTNN